MKLLSALLAVSVLLAVLVLSGCSDSSTGPGETPDYPEIDGLIVFYPFDGDCMNKVADAHHGTPSRAVTFVPGRSAAAGQAVHVETNDYVLVPDDPELDITGAITLAAWVNPEASDRALAAVIDKNYNDAYTFGMWGGIADPETTYMRTYISGAVVGTGSLIPMGMDVWSHIAFTFDEATDRYRFYFNGSVVDSGLRSETIGTSDTDLRIGCSFAGDGYKGKIDEVAIFDRALTPSEITELYSF
ncbi:MAG: LamG domain-containing protein [Candidatus Eisenbacteria bacterium]